MVIAVVVSLLVVWIAIGAGVAVLLGRAAHAGDRELHAAMARSPQVAETRTPVRV